MATDTFGEFMREIPLEVRIRSTVQGHFLYSNGSSFMIPLTQSGDADKRFEKKYERLIKEANGLADTIMENIAEWKKDGSPK